MQVYQILHKENKICVLHFGLGLIGNSIFNELLKTVCPQKIIIQKIDIKWGNDNAINDSLAYLKDFIIENTAIENKIYCLWSAGKCGFSSNKKQTASELHTFKLIVNFINHSIAKNFKETFFLLFSSAGGLFENITNVHKQTVAKPVRPYGILKQMQENHLQKLEYFKHKIIFRPSSVYSKNNMKHRLSLINLIIKNINQLKTTYIFGNADTLRDYVCVEDIAIFIANKLLNDEKFEKANFLVSGKPTSIFELKKIIETVNNKNAYFNYSLKKTNAKNITFNKNCIAKDFYATSIRENIAYLKCKTQQ